MARLVRHLLQLGLIAATGAILLRGLDLRLPANRFSHDHFLDRGIEETGAINLVASIYLGYRAFDTLGETLVLLLAVSGVVHYLGKKP